MSAMNPDGTTAASARELPRMLPRPVRAVLDVRDLPTVAYGDRNLMWWGALAFMIVEGMSYAVTLVAYYYLRRNFNHWPPEPTPLPPLWIGTVSLLVLLANVIPVRMFDRAGRRRDRVAAMRWLWISVAGMAVACALRILEIRMVGARWDEHAYGSVVWGVMGFHFTLIATDAIETGGLAAVFSAGRDEAKHLVDATDNALYSWFSIATWIPGFVTIYLVPRWW